MHARNYRVPAEQRQIIRILYLPMVYGVISFLSYRFFRSYTYYSLVEIAYEALTISAFLLVLLLIQYVAATASDYTAEGALARKDKKKLPLPLCCWRYRPTKPYFMYTLKWAVLQYAVIRPAVSIAGIVCEALGVLCESVWSVHYAGVYLEAVDFVSISVALYGLIIFYGLTKEELIGRRPLAKFMAIKLIVFFTFYQTFVFDLLQKKGAIHGTQYWTESNIVDGLNALATTIEMVLFALFMLWAYPASEYKDKALGERRGFGKAILDSLNYADFAVEIYLSMKFFYLAAIGRPETRAQKDIDEHGRTDFEKAFLPGEAKASYRAGDDSAKGLFQRNAGANSAMNSVDGRTMSPNGTSTAEDEYITSPAGRYAASPSASHPGSTQQAIPMRDLERRK
ncbi:hypothetical protein FRB90_004441 [Tulasnella sp. 427]|nr:hypothetical protein FRB90_004441 [Tulasnella sp. 427]